MRQKMLTALLVLSLLLSGCSWSVSPYVSVTPHKEQQQNSRTDVVTASNYLELLESLKAIIADGVEVSAINVAEYPASTLAHGMERAVQYALLNDPIGAYAVESIVYETGSSSGMPAISVSITYRHNSSEIRRIRRVENMDTLRTAVSVALEGYDPSLVMLVENYEPEDFIQFVKDYAQQNPQTIMETPQVVENIYGTGNERMVELIFSYQTSRDDLRRMQKQVSPVFEAAALYVSGDGEEYQKFSQLFGFLMERFDYKLETSITPAYSLLHHGVGDSRAFATIYAAMCRSAGLECMTVNGTHFGEPWTWNIVREDGYYYHVDLLRSSEYGRYRQFADSSMDSYVWDYSSYPSCVGAPRFHMEQEAAQQPLPTVPSEPTEPKPSEGPAIPEETTPSTIPPTMPEETVPPAVPEETTPPTVPPVTEPPAPSTEPPQPSRNEPETRMDTAEEKS